MSTLLFKEHPTLEEALAHIAELEGKGWTVVYLQEGDVFTVCYHA